MDHSVAQSSSGIGLLWSPSQEAPEPAHLVAGFRPRQSATQVAPLAAHPKGGLSRPRALLGRIPLHRVSTHTAVPPPWSGSVLTVSQLEGQPHAQTAQQPPRFNYSRRAHTTHTRGALEHPAREVRETVPSAPQAICYIHKATLPSLGGIAELPHTQKPTQDAHFRSRDIHRLKAKG